MTNKLGLSQSTFVSRGRDTRFTAFEAKDGQSAMKNPFNQTVPMKFPKNLVVKPCEQTMLHTTSQHPHVSSIRNYGHHNNSRFFEGSPYPLTQTEITSRHPQYLFDSYHQRKLSNSGVFGHLARESHEMPIRLRTYEDIGTVHNERRVFSRTHYKPDPIITPSEKHQYNSTLERSWKEARRHRDNGVECLKLLANSSKAQKREPYKALPKKNGSISYKQIYLRTKGLAR